MIIVETLLTLFVMGYTGSASSTKIVIDVSDQALYLHVPGKAVREFSVSTGRGGIGDSTDQTPLGKMEIEYKVGAGEPPMRVFKGRKPTATFAAEGMPHLMTTRLLVLNGIEERTKSVKDRNIYIHGTADEQSLGKPDSGGCIRMSNKDILEVFDQVKEGTVVEVQE